MSEGNKSKGISRADELNAIGAEYFHKGEMEPARLHFLAALALDPCNHMVLQNMGAVLRQNHFHEAAASMARRSVVASPNNYYCKSNLGVATLALRNYAKAEEILRDVTANMPEMAPSWHNYGLSLYMQGKLSEALKAFNQSLALEPNNIQCLSDRSLTYLSLGFLQKGLKEYESRWGLLYKNKIWNMGICEWQGELLKGKHILVHHEQGFGDSIMLCRFLNDLHKQECVITVAVPAPLQRLLARSFPFAKIIDFNDPEMENLTGFDYHSPMLSVMRWLGKETPIDVVSAPYIFAEKIPQLRLPKNKMKIGICWASGNHGPVLAERRRIVPITAFLPISEIPSVSLISLQKGEGEEDIYDNGMQGIVFDLSWKLEDFATTADVIADLDLVISVDSAVAHIAGGMGKPCLMLSPFTRCWRWWHEDTGWPWYQDMYLYSQSENGSWDKAMEAVTAEVASIMAEM
jgi:tetratricopeptide (TPR) repeat protein